MFWCADWTCFPGVWFWSNHIKQFFLVSVLFTCLYIVTPRASLRAKVKVWPPWPNQILDSRLSFDTRSSHQCNKSFPFGIFDFEIVRLNWLHAIFTVIGHCGHFGQFVSDSTDDISNLRSVFLCFERLVARTRTKPRLRTNKILQTFAELCKGKGKAAMFFVKQRRTENIQNLDHAQRRHPQNCFNKESMKANLVSPSFLCQPLGNPIKIASNHKWSQVPWFLDGIVNGNCPVGWKFIPRQCSGYPRRGYTDIPFWVIEWHNLNTGGWVTKYTARKKEEKSLETWRHALRHCEKNLSGLMLFVAVFVQLQQTASTVA